MRMRLRLRDAKFEQFTPSLEEVFMYNLGQLLGVSMSRLVPVAREAGSVILDILLLPASNSLSLSPGEVGSVRSVLLPLGGHASARQPLQDPTFGALEVVLLQDPSTTTAADSSGAAPVSSRVQHLLIPALVMCLAVSVFALLSAAFCIGYDRRSKRRCEKLMVGSRGGSNMGSFHRLGSGGSSAGMLPEPPERPISTNVAESSSDAVPTIGWRGTPNTPGSAGSWASKRKGRETRELLPIAGGARVFPVQEIIAATGGFNSSALIGMGGSSTVYRGQLADGRLVAVKMLDQRAAPWAEMEFLQEVELLSRLHHVHLVELIGYCMEHSHRCLVYEFMPNGNLREHLSGLRKGLVGSRRNRLSWDARIGVAVDAARGLEYLHESANPRVLHRDFKSTNILVDAKGRAKVADFGMAKAVSSSTGPSSPAHSQLLGTFGYFAPEVAIMGQASVKSDVFSFGVVMLELLTGRPPLDPKLGAGKESLVLWALPRLTSEAGVGEMLDPQLVGRCPREDVAVLASLALRCLQEEPEERPRMPAVVQLLSGLLPQNRGAHRCSMSFNEWVFTGHSLSLPQLAARSLLSVSLNESYAEPNGGTTMHGNGGGAFPCLPHAAGTSRGPPPPLVCPEEMSADEDGASDGISPDSLARGTDRISPYSSEEGVPRLWTSSSSNVSDSGAQPPAPLPEDGSLPVPSPREPLWPLEPLSLEMRGRALYGSASSAEITAMESFDADNVQWQNVNASSSMPSFHYAQGP